jgi:hypothetical protein
MSPIIIKALESEGKANYMDGEDEPNWGIIHVYMEMS